MKQLLVLLLLIIGCTPLKAKDNQEVGIEKAIQKPLPPEKTQELLAKTGENWLFGQGFGETLLTAGTIFAFPPYAIYVVGNGALSLAGYERIAIVDALPEESKESVNSVYDAITEAPGRVSATIAGEEFRTNEKAQADIKRFLDEAYDDGAKK